MKVYRIECRLHGGGPFYRTQHKKPKCLCALFACKAPEYLNHAWYYIPNACDDGLEWCGIFAFTSISKLKQCVRPVERKKLARHNFVLACYHAEQPAPIIGKSGIQCVINPSTATKLWVKSLG